MFQTAHIVIVFSTSAQDALPALPPHSSSSSSPAPSQRSTHEDHSAIASPSPCCTHDLWYPVIQVLAHGGYPVVVDLSGSGKESHPCRQRHWQQGRGDVDRADEGCGQEAQVHRDLALDETLRTGHPDLEIGTDYIEVELEQILVRDRVTRLVPHLLA